ncbi:hypothetical protein E2C01_028384 [Portunus trituberculatus]|uniref:Uncharacterized protein n=1 Tax=Portunus trituberculatus TaxID=210409 RepID=A0A5B7ENW0_PORTR|nr:hypothetical protein [Portunus trituberculatus]
MATPNPALESPSGEGTRNVPMSDCSLVGDPKCLDTSLNFFYINFCNIRGTVEEKYNKKVYDEEITALQDAEVLLVDINILAEV